MPFQTGHAQTSPTDAPRSPSTMLLFKSLKLYVMESLECGALKSDRFWQSLEHEEPSEMKRELAALPAWALPRDEANGREWNVGT